MLKIENLEQNTLKESKTRNSGHAPRTRMHLHDAAPHRAAMDQAP